MLTHRSFSPRYTTKKRARPRFTTEALYLAVVGAGVVGYFGVEVADMATSLANFSMACNIKGNVTIGSRERIYHMPGQEYYDETRISPRSGERWLCSEAEARAAGWRRAIR
ncbi:sunset domain-containing protein [Rhizobium leguminosarum]|uniref:sunset domain-containing protein n=1 Tax=Rhizobium leguminosarum TaxID=384 RepID=UPI003D050485